MLSTCCRCALACSVAASLAAVPARAQDLGSSIVEPPAAPASPATQQSPFPSRQKSNFSALFDDFRALPERQNLLILGIGGLAAGSAHGVDGGMTRSLSNSTRLGTVFTNGEMLGSARTQFAAAVATQVVGHAIRNPKVSALGADLVRAQIVTQTMTFGIKMAARRTRPDGTQFSF